MKMNSTFKQILLAFTIVLSVAACKKDKKDPDPTPPTEVKAITLTELKALSTGASVKVPDAKKITGVVISDVSNKNIDSKTVVLQDVATQTGIIISFDVAQTFAVGDQLEVNVSNQTLAQVNGEVVLQNVPAANAKKTGTGTITAKTTTAAEIATNKTTWDGTLVTIAATELTGTTGKYAGTLTIKDASGTVSAVVLAGAAFENTDLPPSVSSVTGIVRVNGNDTRVDIRKTADVAPGAITRILVENFDNITENDSKIEQQQFGNLTGAFTTAFGQWWSTGSRIYKYPGSLYDAAFTTPGKSYVYIVPSVASGTTGGTAPTFIMPEFTNLQGVKTVKITFAGSMANAVKQYDRSIGGGYGDELQLNPFDPAVDNVQIGVYLKAPSAGPYTITRTDGTEALSLLKVSPQYKETGKFYSFTYTMPTKAELLVAGISEQDADAFLAQPNIVIYNYSTRTGTVTFPNRAPVLFDKIEFGF